MMETTQMRKTQLEFGAGLELGPDLTEQEWQETLQCHRKAMIAKLRAIFRQDVVVTEQQRKEIERAAHGMWAFDMRDHAAVSRAGLSQTVADTTKPAPITAPGLGPEAMKAGETDEQLYN